MREVPPPVQEGVPRLGQRVVVLDPDFNEVLSFGNEIPGEGLDQFLAPHGIAIDSHGDVYVAEVSYTAYGSKLIAAAGGGEPSQMAAGFGVGPGAGRAPIVKVGSVGVRGTVDHWRREAVTEAIWPRYTCDPAPLGSGLRRKDGWWWVSGEGWG